jgi:hypothetical protein
MLSQGRTASAIRAGGGYAERDHNKRRCATGKLSKEINRIRRHETKVLRLMRIKARIAEA